MLIPIKDENPTRTFPIITILLIIINVAVFFYSIQFTTFQEQQAFLNQYAMIPKAITTGVPVTPNSLQPVYLTLITSMFLHGSILHILFNMLYLWIFGNNVEDVLGRFKFILFYFASGIAGSILQIATDPYSTIPNIGASGAISGILGGYLIMFPSARIVTIIPIFFFIQIVRIPAIVMIGFWFILQIMSGLFSLGTPGGGVAYFAHIGGFLGGLFLMLLLPRKKRPSRYYHDDFYFDD